MTQTPKRSSRILIATKFRFIGDTLVAIPVIRAVRAQWPEAKIDLLTGYHARQLLENNPYLNEMIEFDPTGRDQGLNNFFRIVRQLRTNRYDLSLVLNRSFHSALMPWLAGAHTRAGFCSEGRALLLNRSVPYDSDKSEIGCYFDIVKAVAPGIDCDPRLELWISDTERADLSQALRAKLGASWQNHRLIGIQPGASLPVKRWDPNRFAQVADALALENSRARIIVIGSPDEKVVATEMLAQCSENTRQNTINFAGAFNLRGSLALLSYLNLFIGNDTAIMHSAVALKVPTVAIFGPTSAKKWGNFGPQNQVLTSPDGTMTGIDVPEVLGAINQIRTMAGAVLVREGG